MDYVLNPDSKRLIQKGGAAYRDWKRRHPEATDLEPVPFHMLPPRLQRQARYRSGGLPGLSPLSRPPPPVTGRAYTPVRHHSSPDTPMSPLGHVTPPPLPLTRCNAWGPEEFESKRKEEQSAIRAEEHDADILVDEILAQRGPELLQAYQDPQVNFLDALSESFGMTPLPITKP